jgi:hypothetical protein
MKKYLTLGAVALLGMTNLNAQTTHFQGFDNATTNNWNFTITPARYNNVSLFDVWSDTTALGATNGSNVGIPAAAQGTRFWGMCDLENPATTSPYVHTLDFEAIDLAGISANTLKFKYFTNIINGSGDSLGYIVEYTQGATWNMANYVPLSGSVQHWDSVAVNIPSGSPYIRIRFRARINGNEDWAGIDAVSLAGNTTAAPGTVGFLKSFETHDEAADTISIGVRIINENTNPATLNVSLVPGFGTAIAPDDFELLTSSLTFDNTTTDTQYVKVRILNDAVAEKAEYFALELTNPVNALLGQAKTTQYIKDNDYVAPAARKNIELMHLGSYQVPIAGSSAEIVAYDSLSNRLFVVNSLKTILHILDFNNPAALTAVDTVDMSVYGGGITSVAVHKGLVAVAVSANTVTDNGKVVFLDTAGTFLNEVEAGSLPDMVTFTPDGKFALAANEGQPNDDYSIDPEGSVTVIDLQAGVAGATAATAGFAAYNGQEAQLRSQGIRIFGANNASAAKDFEPEYITVSPSSDTAWITLQENNAIAVLHIASKTITGLLPLKAADHMQPALALDASDNNGEILIANWPVHGLYLPDAIANYSVNGKKYLITANEGDAREYDGLEEEVRIGSAAYVLDPVLFPNASLLKATHNLGRLNALNTLGDTDGDGDIDSIYVMGSRSFTIWNTAGQQVYNSGDQFEQINKADPKTGHLFNSDNEGNNFKNRSDNKGPEPEGVAIGTINDTTYAFIALERAGGVMVYDVSVPAAPVFVQYINTRDTSAFGGDNGAEGILFLPAAKSKTGKNYVITANEISGTVAVFEVKAAVIPPPVGIADPELALEHLNAYPNPVSEGQLFFSRPVSGAVYDMNGRAVMSFPKANSINVSRLSAGTYLLKAAGYKTVKIVVP